MTDYSESAEIVAAGVEEQPKMRNPKMCKPWKPGQSGNPKGRPTSPEVKEFRERLKAYSQKALDLLFEKLEASDDAALALFFKLWAPPLKPETPPVEIPAKRGATFKDKADTVLSLMLAGQLSPTTASEIFDAISSHNLIVDLADVKQMLTEWRDSRKTS